MELRQPPDYPELLRAFPSVTQIVIMIGMVILSVSILVPSFVAIGSDISIGAKIALFASGLGFLVGPLVLGAMAWHARGQLDGIHDGVGYVTIGHPHRVNAVQMHDALRTFKVLTGLEQWDVNKALGGCVVIFVPVIDPAEYNATYATLYRDVFGYQNGRQVRVSLAHIPQKFSTEDVITKTALMHELVMRAVYGGVIPLPTNKTANMVANAIGADDPATIKKAWEGQ
jgi:hypothetical protein